MGRRVGGQGIVDNSPADKLIFPVKALIYLRLHYHVQSYIIKFSLHFTLNKFYRKQKYLQSALHRRPHFSVSFFRCLEKNGAIFYHHAFITGAWFCVGSVVLCHSVVYIRFDVNLRALPHSSLFCKDLITFFPDMKHTYIKTRRGRHR